MNVAGPIGPRSGWVQRISDSTPYSSPPGIATIGYGGALGLEGPSIYLGAAAGSLTAAAAHGEALWGSASDDLVERDVAALGNEVAYPVALRDVLARHHVAHLKGLPGNDHLGDLTAIALERLRTLSVGIRANLLPVGQA